MAETTPEQELGPAQLGFEALGFDTENTAAARSYAPDQDEVRGDLVSILEAARAVTAGSLWDRRTYLYNKTVFPQMSRWLPDDERDQLCFEFARELERIELLLAA
jgi:hypothetical protein